MLWYVAFVALMGGFGLAVFVGAPYVPILRRDYEPLLKITGLRAGQTLIDLGSGDGRLMRAAAAQGIRCIGYEINPVLYLVSLIVCLKYRNLVTIHLGDYWHAKLPPADVIYVFLIERFMPRLNKKLKAEVAAPTKVVSFIFEIPGQTPVLATRNTFIYNYPSDVEVAANVNPV